MAPQPTSVLAYRFLNLQIADEETKVLSFVGEEAVKVTTSILIWHGGAESFVGTESRLIVLLHIRSRQCVYNAHAVSAVIRTDSELTARLQHSMHLLHKTRVE